MIPKALSIFIFSITIQQLATYTTRRIDKDLVFYVSIFQIYQYSSHYRRVNIFIQEWDDYLTRTTNRAQRLEWLQQNMIMLDVIPDLVYEVPQDICEVRPVRTAHFPCMQKSLFDSSNLGNILRSTRNRGKGGSDDVLREHHEPSYQSTLGYLRPETILYIDIHR